jgi:hypothetical protein
MVADTHVVLMKVVKVAHHLMDNLALRAEHHTVAALAVVEAHIHQKPDMCLVADNLDVKDHLGCTQKRMRVKVRSYDLPYTAGIPAVQDSGMDHPAVPPVEDQAVGSAGAVVGRIHYSACYLRHSACLVMPVVMGAADHSGVLSVDLSREDAAAMLEYSARPLGGTRTGRRGPCGVPAAAKCHMQEFEMPAEQRKE